MVAGSQGLIKLYGAHPLLFQIFLAFYVSTLTKEALSHSLCLLVTFCVGVRLKCVPVLLMELLEWDILSPPPPQSSLNGDPKT